MSNERKVWEALIDVGEAKKFLWQGIVVHSLNPSFWDAETGESLWILDHSEFNNGHSYIDKPCLKSTLHKDISLFYY